ncbi:uncharacterized protein PG986_011698 [Apiospora aurea]|uniref:Uncharacterized protein n=1 Tax=Apiospora aurea TaxID=335848 RepID=A0ABR1PXX3_9PEZI
MIIPTTIVVARRESSSSSDPAADGSSTGGPRNLIIISTVLGSALLLATVLTLLLLWSRKRQRRRAEYREARLRDPTLTWDDYERRRKLRRSMLMWEEEVQRDIILRKTLQSRTSFNTSQSQLRTARTRTPPSPTATAHTTHTTHATRTTHTRTQRQPKRMRSQSWHPSTVRAGTNSASFPEMTENEHRDGFVQEWRDIEASLDMTWQILTGKRHPSTDDTRRHLLRDSSDEPLARPPTALLKQPSLWAHPAFRGLVRTGPKHSSLPATISGTS